MEGMESTERTPSAPTPAASAPAPSSPAAAEPAEPASPAPPAPSGRVADDAPQREAALPPERLAELRARARAGAYEAAEVADEVARRLLADGDV